MWKIEDVVNIHALKRQGLSQCGIARKLGIHCQTVKKYLDHLELIQRGHQRIIGIAFEREWGTLA